MPPLRRARPITATLATLEQSIGVKSQFLPSNATADKGDFGRKSFLRAEYCGHRHGEAHIEVRWLSGKVESFHGLVKLDHFYVITEGERIAPQK